MKDYTSEQINKEYKEICNQIDTRFNDDGAQPHEILESESFTFACVQEMYSRITNDMEDSKFTCADEGNILEQLAAYFLEYDNLEFTHELYTMAVKENSELIKEVN